MLMVEIAAGGALGVTRNGEHDGQEHFDLAAS
jgi:hypothetical protein